MTCDQHVAHNPKLGFHSKSNRMQYFPEICSGLHFHVIWFGWGQFHPYLSGLLHWHWGHHDCPSASEVTLKNMSKSITWINYLGIHNAITTNHSTAKLRAYLMHYTSNILSPNEAICFVYKTHQTASHGKPSWLIPLHAIPPLLQFEENQSVTPCVSKS